MGDQATKQIGDGALPIAAALVALVLIALGLITAMLGGFALGSRDDPELATRISAEVSRNVRALEQDLATFLLADGIDDDALRRRVEQVATRFAWAHPLFVIGPDGAVLLGPSPHTTDRDPTGRREQRRRRFINLLRRARSQQVVGGTVEDGATHPAHFSAADPRQGLHVLLPLVPDKRWSAFRIRPALVSRLLESAADALPAGADARLLAPDGRVLSTTGADDQATVATSAAPLDVVPGWTVQIATPSAGRPALPVGWIALLAGIASVAVGVATRRARPRVPARTSGPHGATDDGREDGGDGDDGGASTNHVTMGAALVDFRRYEVRRGDVCHPLTEREVALLRLLVSTPGEVVHRSDILDQVWGYAADVTTRTVDTFVYRLRQKIEADPQAPRHLQTVRGAGYRFVP